MITENDHNVKLYNGDIGLCLAKGKYGLAIEKFQPVVFPLTSLRL